MYAFRTATPRLSAIRARQSNLVDRDDEDSDEMHSLGDGIENINIEQFASPGLSSTRLGDPVLEICSKFAPNFKFNR